MGATLSEPVKEKVVEEHEDENYDVGAVAMQGWRTEMEDAHVAKSGLRDDPDAGVFAVFDGHCGSEVSRFAARYLPGQLERTQGWAEGDVKRGLRDTFLRLDQALLHVETQPFLKGIAINADRAAAQGLPSRPAEKWPSALGYADEHMAEYPPDGLAQPNLDTHHLAAKVASLVDSKIRLGTAAGCTACAAVVRRGSVTVANAGDSRCVLCRGGAAVDLSSDHKPDLPEELARIEEAGGFVRNGRTCGNLSLSRALGDFEFKRNSSMKASQQMITAMPEIREQELQEDDEFLILACDGIWENLSSQQVVDFVRQRLQAGDSPAEAAAALCDHCLAPTLYSDTAANRMMDSAGLPGEPVSCTRPESEAEENGADPKAAASGAGQSGGSLSSNVAAAMQSVNAEAAAAGQDSSEALGLSSAKGQAPPADVDPTVGPAYSEDDGECNPWDAFATAMQLMRDKPDASEAEIAEAVSTCSIGGASEPERMPPAELQTAATQLKAAPRPLGPDSKDGYGCDNMSVLIVQLKDRVKSRARAGSRGQAAAPAAFSSSAQRSSGSHSRTATLAGGQSMRQPLGQWGSAAALQQARPWPRLATSSGGMPGRVALLPAPRAAASAPKPQLSRHCLRHLHAAARQLAHVRL
jgi:protein phosphatase 1G